MTNLIDNVERAIRVFGEWPTFHDSEVIRLCLDRSGSESPTLELQIDVIDRPRSGDHTLVTLRFTKVALLEMAEFNEQNVLFDVRISPLDPEEHDGRRLLVEMNTSYGLTAAFECARGEMTDVGSTDRRA